MVKADKFQKIAERYGTPYFLFEIDALFERVEVIKQKLQNKADLCYAVKANPFLISYLDQVVEKFEVCSPGEYEICRTLGIDTRKIVLSGVYKNVNDLRETFEDMFEGVYTIESKQQCNNLCSLAKQNKRKIHVLLRLTSGNQFGMNREDIEAIINDKDYMDYLLIDGIHFFSGTQKKNLSVVNDEIRELVDFCDGLKQKYGFAIQKLEYGPGLYIDYFGNEAESYSHMEALCESLSQVKDDIKVTIELGRYLTALCGKYITKVVDVKRNQNINYAIVDGGINHIDYYGQMTGIREPHVSVIYMSDRENRQKERWIVCGALCTVHDILLKKFEAESVKEGDFFVFQDAGAYAVTDTKVLFLSRDLPAVLIEQNGKIECLREKKTTSTLNRKDKEG